MLTARSTALALGDAAQVQLNASSIKSHGCAAQSSVTCRAHESPRGLGELGVAGKVAFARKNPQALVLGLFGVEGAARTGDIAERVLEKVKELPEDRPGRRDPQPPEARDSGLDGL